jgi:hypothetical protein
MVFFHLQIAKKDIRADVTKKKVNLHVAMRKFSKIKTK